MRGSARRSPASSPRHDPLRLDCVELGGCGLGPVGDASADAVFSFDVFVHLPRRDTFNYLSEIRRVLRPGGKAIIGVASAPSGGRVREVRYLFFARYPNART